MADLEDKIIHVLEEHIHELQVANEKLRKSQCTCGTGVRKFAGYTQSAYRLCFNYEDKHGPEVPHLTTILPNGVIETEKDLVPKPEKGLLAYAYTQTMASEEVATQHLASPYVWRREEGEQQGSYALVQTWTTNYNQSFRDSYTITTTNPDSSKYDPVAVNEFHRVCMALFGAAATSQPVLYCHKATHCKNKSVYTGTPQALMTMLRDTRSKVADEMNITQLSANGNGFTAKRVDGNGKEGTTEFEFGGADEEYALYTKVGWNTMACIAPVSQFLHGSELHEELPIMPM